MKTIKKHKELLLLIFILLVAAFFRLYKIADYMTFLGDEGRDALVVYNILHGKFTLLGPTASVGGFFLGPIYYYFMAPFFWLFGYNPVGPAIMVALFGIATVWLVYKVGSDFFSKPAGLMAAALYAISPVVVAFSRSSWNPNPLPFFSLACLYILYKATVSNKKLFFVVSGMLFGIALQLHYLATFLGVIITLYILLVRVFTIKRSKVFLRLIQDYVLVFLGFLIGFSPFLAFEVRHGFPNTNSIISFIFNSPDTGGDKQFFSTIGDVYNRLFARLITKYPPPEQVSMMDSLYTFDLLFTTIKTSITLLYFFTLFLALGSTLLLLWQFVKSVKKRGVQFSAYLLLIVWVGIGIFLYGFYKKAIYDYYLGFLFTAPFILVGNFLVMLPLLFYKSVEVAAKFFSEKFVSAIKTKKTTLLHLGTVITGVIFLLLILQNASGAPFRLYPNRQYEQVKEIAKAVMDKTDGKPFNFALITGGNSDHGYRFFFKLWGHEPITIQPTIHDPERNTVTDQLLVVCETNPCAPVGHSLWEIAGFGPAEIVGEWQVSVLKVYKLVHYKEK